MKNMSNQTFTNEDLILVTGASSGLGYATVIELLNSGARVIGVARREDKLKEISEKYKNFFYEIKDVSEIETLEAFTKELVEKYGKFSGFAHCAGVLNPQPLAVFDYKDAIYDFKVNVFSAIELTKGLCRKKARQELLSIVYFSSITANIGNPGALTYSMTKTALNNLVTTLTQEVGGQRIRFNSILPGGCKTDMASKYNDMVSYDYLEKVREKNIFHEDGKPEYIANIISFLLSKQSYWIQGQHITVDGGETVG